MRSDDDASEPTTALAGTAWRLHASGRAQLASEAS